MSMLNDLQSLEQKFQNLEDGLCKPGVFICPPRPPVPLWLFESGLKDEFGDCLEPTGARTQSIIGSEGDPETKLVVSLVIAAIAIVCLIVLISVGCVRYHKKKKINPMNMEDPGTYLYNRNVPRKRTGRVVNSLFPPKSALKCPPKESSLPCENHKDVENGDETVTENRVQNCVDHNRNQASSTSEMTIPGFEEMTIENDATTQQDPPIQQKSKHKKKKKKVASQTLSSQNNHEVEPLRPPKLPPLNTPQIVVES